LAGRSNASGPCDYGARKASECRRNGANARVASSSPFREIGCARPYIFNLAWNV
jgi:hypothetical protein